MNERIRELIEQATESTGFLTAGDSVPPLPVREFNKEKFAELIVRECADIVEETRWMVPPSQEQIARSIKQHFGIEDEKQN